MLWSSEAASLKKHSFGGLQPTNLWTYPGGLSSRHLQEGFYDHASHRPCQQAFVQTVQHIFLGFQCRIHNQNGFLGRAVRLRLYNTLRLQHSSCWKCPICGSNGTSGSWTGNRFVKEPFTIGSGISCGVATCRDRPVSSEFL